MYKQINLFSDAARNISQIKDELGNNSDLLIREFDIQIKKTSISLPYCLSVDWQMRINLKVYQMN